MRMLHALSRRGSTLTLVVPCLFMLSVLGISLIGASLTGTRAASRRRASAAAFELAEAGFNHGVRTLRENKNWSGTGATSLGAGSFEVTVTTSTTDWNKRTVRAVGRIIPGTGAVTRTVRGMVDFQSPIWDYSIITKEALSLAGTVTINSSPATGIGNVHSNTNVTVGSSTLVNGNARRSAR